jgi:hypothetical protein
MEWLNLMILFAQQNILQPLKYIYKLFLISDSQKMNFYNTIEKNRI